MKKWMKWIFAILLVGIIVAAALYWYVTRTYDNTVKLKTAFTTTANTILNEVEKSDTAAIAKYKNSVIEITGKVLEVSLTDTTAAVILVDSLGKSQILCSFQPQSIEAVKLLKEGSSVTIKGVFTTASAFKKEVIVANNKVDTVATSDDDFGMLDVAPTEPVVIKPATVYEVIKKVTLIRCGLIVKD